MFDKKGYLKQYYINNREKFLESRKQYCIDNKDKVKECNKRYYINNLEKLKKQHKLYRENNLEKCKNITKQWRKDNPEKERKSKEKWSKDNFVKVKKYNKNKRKTDLKFNLNGKMSIAIGLALKGNKAGRRWETLVGYTLNDLMKHLKKTMPEGYCWQDFLQGELHIDHKVPKSVFNYTKPEHIDFKRAWALSNLQLLPAKENLIKHNKLTRPFQPALQI